MAGTDGRLRHPDTGRSGAESAIVATGPLVADGLLSPTGVLGRAVVL